jgi:hypothetical protein
MIPAAAKLERVFEAKVEELQELTLERERVRRKGQDSRQKHRGSDPSCS